MNDQQLNKLRTKYLETKEAFEAFQDSKRKSAATRARKRYLRALEQLQQRFTFEVDNNADPRVYE